MSNGWIGVDLDGVLAEYHGWMGAEFIGPPIPLVVEKVKQMVREGMEVRIFTARATIPEQIPPVQKWLEENGLGGLHVTNVKDIGCLALWDDRCVQYVPNTGISIETWLTDAERATLEHFKADCMDTYSKEYIKEKSQAQQSV